MTTTVVCFGDSNTYGMPPMTAIDDIRRFSSSERWPGIAARELGPDWTIVEEAQPGRTTVHDDPIEGKHKNGLRSLPVVLESHRPFEIIVIMLGTNDLRHRFSLTADDVAASLAVLTKTVLASIAGPDSKPPKILLVAPPPIIEVGVLAGLFPGAAEVSSRVAPLVDAVAKRFGVEFLDAGQVIVMDETEGTHFTADQHALLGQAIAAKLKTMV